ncbi:MAG: DUF2079 domain-containing protein, partial [Ktedonobacterales bacterium]
MGEQQRDGVDADGVQQDIHFQDIHFQDIHFEVGRPVAAEAQRKQDTGKLPIPPFWRPGHPQRIHRDPLERAARRLGAVGRAWDWVSAHEEAFETPDEIAASAAKSPVGATVNRWGLGLVALVALVYTVILSLYCIGLHDAFRTHAEDLGIMDQVLWNTAHGHFMLQTICNPVTDVNCLGGVTRFSVHFEPILIPLTLLYVIFPNVQLLLVFQAAAVAIGAIPAYLLAARRLRHVAWGVIFAGVYLLYPPLLNAVIDDFHPETAAAGLLMWALYFLFTRRYRALVIACVVLLLCKETLTLDVIGIGLFVALIQRRPRLGFSLVALGGLTLGLALLLMRIFSPLGHSPVTSRFDALLHDPLHTLATYAHDPARRAYLVKLLAPVGFLALLAPWVAVIALPSVLLNVLSADPLMYSGLYQYNTDIGPVLIAAAIDALVWLVPAATGWLARLRLTIAERGAPHAIVWLLRTQVVVTALVLLALVIGGQGTVVRAYRSLTLRNAWPQTTAHTQLGEQFLAQIPPDASVSAQATLAPHLSQRLDIHQFPSGALTDDYVALDVTTGNDYPFSSSRAYLAAVQGVLHSCVVTVAGASDGYLLLRHIPGASQTGGCVPTLPVSFYSFIYRAPPADAHSVAVTYGGVLELTSYEVNPPQVYTDQPEVTITTCWQALTALTQPLTVVVTLAPQHGGRLVFEDLVGQEWLAPQQWTPGRTVCLTTWPIYLTPDLRGQLLLGAEARAGAPADNPPVTATLPITSLTTAPGVAYPQSVNGK